MEIAQPSPAPEPSVLAPASTLPAPELGEGVVVLELGTQVFVGKNLMDCIVIDCIVVSNEIMGKQDNERELGYRVKSKGSLDTHVVGAIEHCAQATSRCPHHGQIMCKKRTYHRTNQGPQHKVAITRNTNAERANVPRHDLQVWSPCGLRHNSGTHACRSGRNLQRHNAVCSRSLPLLSG